jgi:hypothetical protein
MPDMKKVELSLPRSSSADRSRKDRQLAKSNNPDTGEDENEATEANFSGKKEDKKSSKRWLEGKELTRPKYWASAACWSQDGRNCQEGVTRRKQW